MRGWKGTFMALYRIIRLVFMRKRVFGRGCPKAEWAVFWMLSMRKGISILFRTEQLLASCSFSSMETG
jgi:hypothetical protein